MAHASLDFRNVPCALFPIPHLDIEEFIGATSWKEPGSLNHPGEERLLSFRNTYFGLSVSDDNLFW
jgi:hypothetical protein